MVSFFSKVKKIVEHFQEDATTSNLKQINDNVYKWQLERIGLSSIPNNVLSAAYDTVQGLVALGTSNGTIHLMGKPGAEVVLYTNDPMCRISALYFITNRGMLCGICESKCNGARQYICVWSLKNMRLKYQLRMTDDVNQITCVICPIESKFIFIGTTHGVIIPFNVNQRWISSVQVTPLLDKAIQCMELHPSNSYLLLSGHSDGYCSIYDFKNRKKELYSVPNYFKDVKSISWHPKKNSFVASYSDGKVIVWNMGKITPHKIITNFEKFDLTTVVSWVSEGILIKANKKEDCNDTSPFSEEWEFVDEKTANEAQVELGQNQNRSEKDCPTSELSNDDVVNKEVQNKEEETNINTEDSIPSKINVQSEANSLIDSPTSTISDVASPLSVLSAPVVGNVENYGLYIVNIKSNEPTVQRLNPTIGLKTIILEPSHPWKLENLPTYVGCISNDKKFHVLNLKERNEVPIGNAPRKHIKQFYTLHPQITHNTLSNEQCQPISGGLFSNFSFEKLQLVCTLNDDNELQQWFLDSDSGSIISKRNIMDQVTFCIPWSDTCMICVQNYSTIVYLHLPSKTQIDSFVISSDTFPNQEELPKIQSLLPIQYFNIIVVALSNGTILLISGKTSKLILKEELNCEVISMEYMLQPNSFSLLLGNGHGNIQIVIYQVQKNITKLYHNHFRATNTPISHIKSLSLEGLPSNRCHMYDVPSIFAGKIESDSLVFNVRNNNGPIELYTSKNESFALRLSMKKKVLSTENEFTLSFEDSESKTILSFKFSIKSITIGHLATNEESFTSTIDLKEEDTCSPVEYLFIYEQKSCSYRIYQGDTFIEKINYPRKQRIDNSFVRATLTLENGTGIHNQDLKHLKSLVKDLNLYRDVPFTSPIDWSQYSPNVKIQFSTHFYPTPKMILIGSKDHLILYKINPKGELYQLKKIHLIATQIQDLQVGTVKNIKSAIVTRTDGQLEIFAITSQNLERIFSTTLLSQNLIRSHEPPTHFSLIGDEVLAFTGKDFFMTCCILAPKERREIPQSVVYTDKPMPSKPSYFLGGIKNRLNKKQVNDISKLDSELNGVDIQEEHIRLVDIEESAKQSWSAEVLQEASEIASKNIRFIQGQSSTPNRSYDQLNINPTIKSTTPLQGDSSNVFGELDDMNALLNEVKDKAKLRGQKLKQLEESTLEMRRNAEEFAMKTKQLASKKFFLV